MESKAGVMYKEMDDEFQHFKSRVGSNWKNSIFFK